MPPLWRVRTPFSVREAIRWFRHGVRDGGQMATKLILNRTRVTLAMCLLAAIPLGCHTGTPSRTAARNSDAASSATPPTLSASSSPTSRPLATSSATVAPSGGTTSAGDAPTPDLTACQSQQPSGVTRHNIATLTRGVGVNGPLQVVVSRTGTATVAWMVVPGGEHYFGPNYVAVGDDPPGPGDPHYPPRPPDAQNPLDAQYDGVLPADQPGESLAIDGADVQTLIWFEDLLTPPGPNQDYTEFYDVVASAGPSVADGRARRGCG